MWICGKVGYCSRRGKHIITIKDAGFHTCRLRKNACLCVYSLPVEFVKKLDESMFELLKNKISIQPERT